MQGHAPIDVVQIECLIWLAEKYGEKLGALWRSWPDLRC